MPENESNRVAWTQLNDTVQRLTALANDDVPVQGRVSAIQINVSNRGDIRLTAAVKLYRTFSFPYGKKDNE